MLKLTTRKITRAATIAALYAVTTMLIPELGYGPVQFRLAEALTILPLFMPEAILGLTIGCFIANIIGYGIIDVVFGTLATLSAAILTYVIGQMCKKHIKLIGVIPPIIINALVVPLIIMAAGGDIPAYYIMAISIFISQTIAICGFGIPLYFLINKYRYSLLFSDGNNKPSKFKRENAVTTGANDGNATIAPANTLSNGKK